jgi:2'-5' RNA ligase
VDGPGEGSRIRLFVALGLPACVLEALISWQRSSVSPLAGVRAIAPDALHVTLCFLGTREVAEVDGIARACSVLAGASVADLRLGSPVWLPSTRRPQVLAVHVIDALDAALGDAQAKLARSLAAIGAYEPERRRFLPHVSVGRVRRGTAVAAAGGGRPALEPPPAVRFDGSRVTLFRSWLGNGPARYEALHSVLLGPS